MQKNKLVVHTHHISSHFTNALWPVGFLFFLIYIATNNESYEFASFYCFVVSTLAGPFTFISGIVDWKSRFEGRSTRIFDHKRFFGLLYVIISAVVVVWRFSDPGAGSAVGEMRPVYGGLLFINSVIVTYLGHLGGKFI